MSPQVVLEDVLSLELAPTTGALTCERPDVHVVQLVPCEFTVATKLLVTAFDITRKERFLACIE